MKIKPINQTSFLKLQKELSDMFEPEKVAHLFRPIVLDLENERIQNEGDREINVLFGLGEKEIKLVKV
jgi:hypothetical protein